MYQHDAQLANIVTSYATCAAGIFPLLYTALTHPQPRRWVMVYACVLLTGIPTVWLHSVEGNLVASLFDTGTNIILAWTLIIAVSGDFMKSRHRKPLLAGITTFDLCVLGWLTYEAASGNKVPLIRFGGWGQFMVGEVALILNCWVAAGLFFTNKKSMRPEARPLLNVTLSLFLVGMVLATASNDHILPAILPWHAMWHLIGAFGFMTLWLMNHQRFAPAYVLDAEEAARRERSEKALPQEQTNHARSDSSG